MTRVIIVLAKDATVEAHRLIGQRGAEHQT
jgi:hypothetical protein